MNIEKVEKVLGRSEYYNLVNYYKKINLKNKKILITGANGSIGTKLCNVLREIKADFLATDIEGSLEYLDVTDFKSVFSWVNKYNPNVIINLAGLKYAPRGEHETWKTVSINTIGTKNILDCADENCKVILTSTCKSCNPEIVYGATKLIAERMVLNNRGSVARFYNVIETQGNVFEIWNRVPPEQPIEVVEECNRYFISISEAVGLILFSIDNPSGRYCVNLKKMRNMKDVADALYPERAKIKINRRRGDRLNERQISTAEKTEPVLHDEILKVLNDHDKE
jgi:FlaA1/EpsC-like NDP-sugar epimerase